MPPFVIASEQEETGLGTIAGAQTIDWLAITAAAVFALQPLHRGGPSVVDIVSQAVAELQQSTRPGILQSASQADLEGLVIEVARRRLEQFGQRLRESNAGPDGITPALSTRDLLEVIVARGLARSYFARLFEALGAEQRILLNELLSPGGAALTPEAIAAGLGADVALIGQLKRQILEQARPVMLGLLSETTNGGPHDRHA